jgi:Na+(H+)/acetate symporter ActP
LPTGSSHLLINLGPTQYLIDPDAPRGRRPFRNVWLSGPHDLPIDTTAPHGQCLLGVAFKPGGLFAWTRPAAVEMAGQVLGLDELFGAEAERLQAALLDSQILALSTMFTEDVFAFYGGKTRFGEAVQVQTGRIFIVLITLFAYVIALRAPETIFELAIQYAFSGFAALSPLLIGALFWKGSTKWGALAVALWTAFAVVAVAVFQEMVPAPAPGPPTVFWAPGGVEFLSRTPGGTAVFGFMPVVPMVIGSALLMFVVSLLTRKPSASTLAKYFGGRKP